MKHQLSINGKRIDAIKGGFFPTINPATEEVIGVVAEGKKEDIDVAVYAAKTCLNGPNWGYASTGEERAVVLRKIGCVHDTLK
jgi:aminomuconate-semialdehyde/2-hydroxymuconate-6-semialdehyde dehydrogenase